MCSLQNDSDMSTDKLRFLLRNNFSEITWPDAFQDTIIHYQLILVSDKETRVCQAQDSQLLSVVTTIVCLKKLDPSYIFKRENAGQSR